MTTETFVKTKQGNLFLKKLCRQFARQLPATVIGSQGRIDLPFGPCRIRVTEQNMHVHVNVDNEQDIDIAERNGLYPIKYRA